MADHLADEEELEKLKTWWKDNWIALVGGLVIGFGGIGGWEGYKGWKAGQANQASNLYEQFRTVADGEGGAGSEAAQSLITKLKDEYARTPYPASASLFAAKSLVENDDLESAVDELSWVIDHADDHGLVHVARLRKARLLLAMDKTDEALAVVTSTTDAPQFMSLYEEVRGDIQHARGDLVAARSAYQKALDAAQENAANRFLLQQKLDDLAAAS